MESVLDYLKRNLRAAGPSRWEPIAEEAGVSKALPRKLVYDDRKNPGLLTVQPLIDYFHEVDRGERALPNAEAKAA